MNYIENIYICLMAPLLIAVLCTRGRGRAIILFLLGGMTVCLLSSYISAFVAAVKGADMLAASVEISPLVEEIMKFLPVAFYLMVFEPKKESVVGAILMTAIGFATFENVCYLTQNGAMNFTHLLIRGFGTGSMHIVCGCILVIGMMALWDKRWLRSAGLIGIVALSATFHGVYNILVSQTGIVATVGYLIPIIAAAILAAVNRRYIFS